DRDDDARALCPLVARCDRLDAFVPLEPGEDDALIADLRDRRVRAASSFEHRGDGGFDRESHALEAAHGARDLRADLPFVHFHEVRALDEPDDLHALIRRRTGTATDPEIDASRAPLLVRVERAELGRVRSDSKARDRELGAGSERLAVDEPRELVLREV